MADGRLASGTAMAAPNWDGHRGASDRERIPGRRQWKECSGPGK